MANAVRILTERDLGDIGGGATPLARFTVAANGNVTTDTTQLTITFTQNATSVTSDLTAAEITLSSGLTKGALTKVSNTVYTLAVTVTAAAAATVTINKPGQVVTTPVMVQVFKAPAGPPQEPAAGYWGVLIPTAPGGTNLHPERPTSAELQGLLTTVNEIHTLDAANIKPSFTSIPRINADDWAATGSPLTVWEATGRYFVLIRADVGAVTGIVNAVGIPQGNDFDQAYIEIPLADIMGIDGSMSSGQQQASSGEPGVSETLFPGGSSTNEGSALAKVGQFEAEEWEVLTKAAELRSSLTRSVLGTKLTPFDPRLPEKTALAGL